MKLVPFHILLFLVLSCSKSDDTPVGTNPEAENEKGLLENETILSSGQEREYHLYIPQNTINAPAVFLFHGNKSNYNEIIGIDPSIVNRSIKAPYKAWLPLAEQEDIILIIPNGTEGASGDNGWNDCRNDATGNPASNDVLFSADLIDFVVAKYQANASKVFAVGTSNGGHMSMRLAQEIPNKITAFAAVVASKPLNSQCVNSSLPISALFMNGTNDPINPFEGGSMAGGRGEVFSTQETINYWINRNQTDTNAIITDFTDIDTSDNCTVKKYVYANGNSNTEVVLYEVDNGGHTEPSIAERYSDFFKIAVKEQNGDIEMADQIWSFFKNK